MPLPAALRFLAAIVVAATILYAPVVGFSFVYDDYQQILSNPNIQGWHGFSRALSTPLWSFDEWKAAGGYFRPLFSVWLTLCWLLFGNVATGWHVVSLLLHIGVALAIWRLGSVLGLGRKTCVIAALVFVIHPINIQAATWLSAAGEPIMAICVLSACALWFRSSAQGRLQRLQGAAAITLLLAAALTLERAWPYAILPPIFFWLHDRTRLVRTVTLSALPVIVALVLRAAVVPTSDGMEAGGPSVGSSLLALPVLVLRYLQNIAFPSTLSLAYPEIANGELGPRFFVGLVVLPIILAGVFQLSRGNRRRQFLALASLIPFIPVLYAGALQQSDLVQDRYIYLPLALGVLWLADVAAAGWSRGGKWRAAVGVAGLGWSLLLVISFRPNLLIWSGQLPLYRRAVEVAPENPKYLMNLSNALRRSDPAADENCELLSRARDMRAQGRPGTDDVTLSFNAGNCHRMQGRPQLAIELYEAAFRLSEGELYPARRNIVSALIDLNRLDEALRITESLTDDFPESGWSWNLNGVVLARMARWPEAERSFRRVLRLTPDDRQAETMLRQVERAGLVASPP